MINSLTKTGVSHNKWNLRNVSITIGILLSIVSCQVFFLNTDVQAKTVIAKGTAAIHEGDQAQARDKAISDALAKAVEMAVGSELESSTVMENYELLSERIYSHSKGYIKNYKVIEEKEKDSLYWVTVKADVSQGSLKNDLAAIGLLMARKKMPRLMILISEQSVGFYAWNIYSTSINQSQSVFIDEFRKKGFKLVDPSTVRRNLDRDAAHKAVAGDDNAAKLIAQRTGAELIVTGKAVAEGGSRIMKSNMYSCSASISARAVRADTGEIIASGSENAVKPHINKQSGNNEALKEAAKRLADSMINQIIERWKSDVYASNSAVLFLISSDATQADDFAAFLKSKVRGVSDVVVRDVTGSSATLDVTLKGDASDLMKELVHKRFQGKKVKVKERTLNKLTIDFE